MCNRYNIKGTTSEFVEHFNSTLPTLFDVQIDDILPGHLAPGLILNRDGERELVPMQFGLAKIGLPIVTSSLLLSKRQGR
jgi:putative SOS response-associated peptidase YedK